MNVGNGSDDIAQEVDEDDRGKGSANTASTKSLNHEDANDNGTGYTHNGTCRLNTCERPPVHLNNTVSREDKLVVILCIAC